MKTKTATALILTLLFALVTGTMAQTGTSKPNQVKLLQKLAGTWQAELGKDTILVTSLKPFGKGLDGNARTETHGKTITERRQLFGYDSKSDRFIEAEVNGGSDMELYSCWFEKDNLMVGVPYAFREEPGKSSLRVEIEIQGPDRFDQTVLQNGKRISGRTMIRKK